MYFTLAVAGLVAGTVLSWDKLFNPQVTCHHKTNQMERSDYTMPYSLFVQASPAASRALNEDCVLLDFYDIHDISHMCYALGCFFLFTVSPT